MVITITKDAHYKRNKKHTDFVYTITIIAFILDNTLYLNTRKYSVTTSKIQSQLRYQAQYTHYNIKEYEEE